MDNNELMFMSKDPLERVTEALMDHERKQGRRPMPHFQAKALARAAIEAMQISDEMIDAAVNSA